MGYDLNKFVDIQELPNHLRCLICNLVLEPLDALHSTQCEHNYCNQCITIHLQSSNHCPHYEEDSVSVKSDKKKSPLRKMSFRKIIGKSPKDKLPTLKLSELKSLPSNLVDELNALKVHCDQFSSNGCKAIVKLIELDEHVKQCKFIDLKLDEQMSVKVLNKIDDRFTEQANTIRSETVEQQSELKDPTRVELSTELISDLIDQEITETLDQSIDMSTKQEKRKNSEAKSIGEPSSKVSEEEVGSDDFVILPKATKVSSSSTKSTESVQTNNSTNNSEPTLISSKENVSKEEDQTTTVDKKKKKKKKKKAANRTDEDSVSLKEADSGSHSELSSKAQSKESLTPPETEDVKRALKEAETKSENLRMINSQLLGQIKKLKEEREEFTKKLQSQLNTDELDNLKNQINQLEKENQQQAHRIVQLLDNNESMNQLIILLRDEQTQLKENFNSTLKNVQKTLKYVSTCKQV